MLFCVHANGQFVNVNPPGNVSENDCYLQDYSLNHSETAVDIIQVGCEVYKIAVSNSSWSLYKDSCSGSALFQNQFSFTNTISNPDVALVYDNYFNLGTLYAIIVYFEPILKQFMAESWDISTGNTPTRIQSYTLQSGFWGVPAQNDNAIRIDANSQGDFVIVWNDFENEKLYLLPGLVYGGNNLPWLNHYVDYSTSEITLAPVEILFSGIKKPDVAISDSTMPKEAYVYVSYIDPDYKKLIVDEYNLNDLWYSGPVWPSPYNPMSMTSNNIFAVYPGGTNIGRPRIATPKKRDAETFVKDWTVVYSVEDNGISHIYGNTRNGGVDYPHNYTNNSEPELIAWGGFVSFNNWQKNPVIAYGFDNNFNVVAQVVWEGGWGEPLNTKEGTDYPTIIAVSIDRIGAVETNLCTGGAALYKMVPTNDPYETFNPSIAGTTGAVAENMTVVWWNETQQNVFEMNFSWCDASYRTPTPSSFQIISDSLKKIPFIQFLP